MTFATSSPGASSAAGNAQGSAPPICQNCTTSTTPLWRRDEAGSVLCNACGLFLKLHGKPRPISLKTDVIKSRNRVKNSGHPNKKKTPVTSSSATSSTSSTNIFDCTSSHPTPRSEAGTPPPPAHFSRAGTPVLPPLFDPLISDHNLPPIPQLENAPPSPPPTVDNLIARNNQLKTRVAELELVNDLFRSRVTELENSEANARRAEMSRQDVEAQLRATLEAALKREGALKRRVEELENSGSGNSRERKKVKVSDLTQ